MDSEFELHHSPMAVAYRNLENLQLGDSDKAYAGDPHGSLNFNEGTHPGSNLTYVKAPDLATIACLQHRLNELNENVRIEIL
jgi:hypothetical protein